MCEPPPARGRLISLASQHDLAGGASGLEELVSPGRLGQGQRRLEMDAELPGIDQSGQGLEAGIVGLDGPPKAC